MPKTKVAVTVDGDLLEELDELIAKGRFPNRSQAGADAGSPTNANSLPEGLALG